VTDLVRLEQRRRAAAKEDGVGRRLVPGASDLGRERVDVLPLHVRVEQPAVEVAVVADVAAKGDVEVKAEHGQLQIAD